MLKARRQIITHAYHEQIGEIPNKRRLDVEELEQDCNKCQISVLILKMILHRLRILLELC